MAARWRVTMISQAARAMRSIATGSVRPRRYRRCCTTCSAVTYAARHWIGREEFLALFEARLAGRLEFLRALQGCAFVRKEPAAAGAPIAAFANYMYGRQGGGVAGPYAHGHRAGIMLCEPFVRSLH